jgi:hypothetical protein
MHTATDEMRKRLRRAVEACRPAGLEVTISMGVAAASGAEVTRADGHEDIAPMLEAVGVVVA